MRLLNFEISSTPSGVDQEVHANYTVASTLLDGAIDVEVTDVIIQEDEDYSVGGEIAVFGANNSTLVTSDSDGIEVTIAVDSDGNGIDADYPKPVDWDDIYD